MEWKEWITQLLIFILASQLLIRLLPAKEYEKEVSLCVGIMIISMILEKAAGILEKL